MYSPAGSQETKSENVQFLTQQLANYFKLLLNCSVSTLANIPSTCVHRFFWEAIRICNIKAQTMQKDKGKIDKTTLIF